MRENMHNYLIYKEAPLAGGCPSYIASNADWSLPDICLVVTGQNMRWSERVCNTEHAWVMQSRTPIKDDIKKQKRKWRKSTWLVLLVWTYQETNV